MSSPWIVTTSPSSVVYVSSLSPIVMISLIENTVMATILTITKTKKIQLKYDSCFRSLMKMLASKGKITNIVKKWRYCPHCSC